MKKCMLMTRSSSRSTGREADDLSLERQTTTASLSNSVLHFAGVKPHVSRAVGSRVSQGQMRIVVDTALNTGAAEYSNMGDVAMLQVGVRRLQRLWPSARIEVLTESPTNLALFCPGANPLPRAGRDLWIGNHAIIGSVDRLLPRAASVGLSGLGRACRRRFPVAFRSLVDLRLSIRDRRNVRPDLNAFLEAMEHADLFVVCGAGGFTDDTRPWNVSILDTIEAALQRNIPVAMFGQGLGPLSDPEILGRARKILPKVSLLTLRGGRGGSTLAQSLGVDSSQILTTGDEAVEIAYEAREKEPGQAVGINLRVASYSNVNGDMIDGLRPVLHEFARRRNVPLIPVPIAFHAWANDHVTIQRLLQGFDDDSDGGIALDTPLKVIRQVGRCRIVVTGAYHAAVFAMSQGIPVVALSASQDYSAKFLGLEDQFGQGCETVFLGASDASERVAAAAERAWHLAEKVRLPLQEAARRQIALSHRAYERIREHIRFNGSSHNLEN
jgi:polysaccharide pyruvyl transferase WcaK-like protein